MGSHGPRTLVLDIETAPAAAWVWSIWNETVPLARLEAPGYVMCFAAKWVGERSVEFHGGPSAEEHAAMVRRAHELMDEADAIVTYNGVSFDLKHLHREFALAKLPPPSPHIDIDLLRTVRRKFKFQSNKLEHVLAQLGLDGKADSGGWETWAGAIAGDEKAWRRMRRYNVQDVRSTEALYLRLLPWIDKHPHHGLYGPRFEDVDRCQRCGSPDLMRRGYYRSGVHKYRQYQCRACGGYSRGRKAVGRVDARAVA